MSPPFPSIQSFFQPEISPSRNPATTTPCETGDGFTVEEIEATLQPKLHKWQPRGSYKEVEIGSLVPGPGCVALMGRVANFYDQATPSKAPQAAKGCLKVIVKDDTGALMVKLWYAKNDYQLRIGQLVSIWTPHVSNAESNSLILQYASLVTSIFPERDNSCYFLVQEKSDEGILCKTPLGYQSGKQLDGLITLKNFMDGGHEVAAGKVLVCVKSIGGRNKFTTKKGNPAEKVDVNVFDDNAEATLTLWGRVAASASFWKASDTILLLSNPAFKNDRKPTVSIGTETHVDVDPHMNDAFWLRGFAQRLTKREHVNQPFPENVFDVEEAASSDVRILFTLADIDEFVRAAPTEHFIGYLSLIIVDLNIATLHQRDMLLCTECCGVPLFANTTTAKCKHCTTDVALRLNPRLIGTLLDETGSIQPGKLIWSSSAWNQLLGRTPEELVILEMPVLRYLEQRLLFLRVTVMFGWSGEVGKVVVLGVGMC